MLTRRELFHILPAGAVCLGCGGAALCAGQTAAQTTPQPPPAGFDEKSDMTWEQVFGFSYKGYANVMKKLAAQAGQDEFLKMLQKASSELAVEQLTRLAGALPKRDLATFATGMKTLPLYRHALVWNIVEESPQTFEIHVSQCLWAKTFRGENAGDIGYAAICYADYAASTAFNPKLKMVRSKTLMQGADCCNHRWVMEG